jgi:hypothetical protein
VTHAGLVLLAFVRLAAPVALDDHQLVQDNALDRAEPLQTALAAATTMDRATLIT